MQVPYSLLRPAAAALVLVIAAGCGSSSSNGPKATATPRATSIPSPLIGYAQNTYPTLAQSITVADQVRSSMARNSLPNVGNACTKAADKLSNFSATFHAIYTPKGTGKAYSTGTKGYKLVLAAMDECGIASDGSNSDQMKSARSDLQDGIDVLRQAETIVSPWRSGQS